jgi:hypothetical protein
MRVPPTSVGEVSLSKERAAASTISELVFVTPFKLAVIVAVKVVVTAFVVTANATVACPALTVTEPGATALELFEETATTFPLGPALPPSVTVS